MGTNFYIDDIHIGKRSAAGYYCWDCEQTLCIEGEQAIHSGNQTWYVKCPKCGEEIMEEDFNESAAGRELGFNKSEPKRKTGVRTCSSFTWALPPHKLERVRGKGKQPRIVDEYAKGYSWDEFQSVLQECPIRYYDMIGKEFS